MEALNERISIHEHSPAKKLVPELTPFVLYFPARAAMRIHVPVKNAFFCLEFALLLFVALFATPAAASDSFAEAFGSEPSEFLQVMKEPNLSGRHMDTTTETYRFLWVPGFHKPVCVRIWKDRSGITLRIVRLSPSRGLKIGHIERDDTFALTPAQWDDFLELLSEAGFWDMSTTNPNDPNFSDASGWVLEGKAVGKYHEVSRSCALIQTEERHLENFLACCRYLLKLAGEKNPTNKTD
jgi:hypothetical protein